MTDKSTLNLKLAPSHLWVARRYYFRYPQGVAKIFQSSDNTEGVSLEVIKDSFTDISRKTTVTKKHRQEEIHYNVLGFEKINDSSIKIRGINLFRKVEKKYFLTTYGEELAKIYIKEARSDEWKINLLTTIFKLEPRIRLIFFMINKLGFNFEDFFEITLNKDDSEKNTFKIKRGWLKSEVEEFPMVDLLIEKQIAKYKLLIDILEEPYNDEILKVVEKIENLDKNSSLKCSKKDYELIINNIENLISIENHIIKLKDHFNIKLRKEEKISHKSFRDRIHKNLEKDIKDTIDMNYYFTYFINLYWREVFIPFIEKELIEQSLIKNNLEQFKIKVSSVQTPDVQISSTIFDIELIILLMEEVGFITIDYNNKKINFNFQLMFDNLPEDLFNNIISLKEMEDKGLMELDTTFKSFKVFKEVFNEYCLDPLEGKIEIGHLRDEMITQDVCKTEEDFIYLLDELEKRNFIKIIDKRKGYPRLVPGLSNDPNKLYFIELKK